MAETFSGVAGIDPLSAALLAIGGLLIALASAAFGYLTLGALVEFVTPESLGRSPPRRG